MANLKDVSLELQRMQREMKKKEAEYNRAKAQPLVVIMFQAALENDEFCKEILNYGREEVRVMAKFFTENFESIMEGCKPELEQLHEKRKQRAEKRKAKAQAKEQPVVPPILSQVYEDEDNWDSDEEEEQYPDAEHDPRALQYNGY